MTLAGLFWQHPWYLLCSLAVVIPLLIHLLNKSRGRLVPFANIRLISAIAPQPRNELKLNQKFLLLLRTLLLLLAAILLAAPWWEATRQAETVTLVSRDWLNVASPSDRQELIANLKENAAILLDGPAEAQSRQWLSADDIQRWQSSASSPLALWSQLQSHAQSLPADSVLSVYVTNRLNQLNGPRLALANPLDWQVNDLQQLLSAQPVEPLSVLIVYDPQRADDLAAINAALDALQQQKLTEIIRQTLLADANLATTLSSVQGKFNALLWLSTRSKPAGLEEILTTNGSLVADAAESTPAVQWQTNELAPWNIRLNGSELERAKPAADSEVLWQTSENVPLLSQRIIDQRRILQFYGRLSADSRLSKQAAFPLILGDWLFSQSLAARQAQSQWLPPALIEVPDSLTVASQQTASKLTSSEQNAFRQAEHSPWLQLIISGLLVLVFCFERLYAEGLFSRRQAKQAVASAVTES